MCQSLGLPILSRVFLPSDTVNLALRLFPPSYTRQPPLVPSRFPQSDGRAWPCTLHLSTSNSILDVTSASGLCNAFMPITLDRLPFDVLFHIVSSLHLDDVVHLSYTCRQLQLLLRESTLCRKTIETHYPYSREAILAQEQVLTYSNAMQSIYDRRDAFSNALPFSACIVGQGNAFLYRQGTLCVLHGTAVRVFNVHTPSEQLELDLLALVHRASESSSAAAPTARFTLLYYSNDVLAIHYEKKGRYNESRVLALSTRVNPTGGRRVLKAILLESSQKLFVRHNGRYLYYGTYSGAGESHGHHEWVIQGVSLDPRFPLSCHKPLQLEEFFGSDIGPTITFEIHDNYFYGVSNQTSFDIEELDWTSFYHVIRFPLDCPHYEDLKVNKRVYRRQHAEGPIHDSWTNISLQVDERTNELVIVESRREWQNGSSRQLRTFYISEPLSKIAFSVADFEIVSDEILSSTEDCGAQPLPPDDPYTHLVDSTNNAHWAPVQPRYTPNFHPEFGLACKSTRSFVVSRTRFRAYSYSCSSFIDLVEDDRCCNNPTALPCLRLRVGSRRVAPLDWTPPTRAPLVSPPFVGHDNIVYKHANIKMWPPPASTCPCSKRLHEILNPQLNCGSAFHRAITATADERSLVYLVQPMESPYSGDTDATGTVVLINFENNARSNQLDAHDDTCAEPGAHFLPTHWQWQAGHQSLCRKAKCR